MAGFLFELQLGLRLLERRWVRKGYNIWQIMQSSVLIFEGSPSLQSRLPPFHLSSHPQIVKCSKANHIIQVKSSKPCTNLKYHISIHLHSYNTKSASEKDDRVDVFFFTPPSSSQTSATLQLLKMVMEHRRLARHNNSVSSMVTPLIVKAALMMTRALRIELVMWLWRLGRRL